ncbi:MAG: hypothetical protein JWN80_1984, partial [Microbacteriaceae bacterium]|nr:hypothetical protein [Microbacteriaceae bacterium]
WVQLERGGGRIDGAVEGAAADQAFRHFMQDISEAAGRPKWWPTNELTVVATFDPELLALARLTVLAREQSREGARA